MSKKRGVKKGTLRKGSGPQLLLQLIQTREEAGKPISKKEDNTLNPGQVIKF